MALFSRKKEEEVKEQTETKGEAPKTAAASNALPTDRDLSSVLIKPRITEKAVKKGEQNVYTFVIRKDATKIDVRDAVRSLFGVTPVKVNIVNKSPRSYLSRMRGRRISEKGMKKAYIYLQEGDSIELA